MSTFDQKEETLLKRRKKHIFYRKLIYIKRFCVFGILLGILCLTGCQKIGKNKVEKYTSTDFVMDTVLNMTFYGKNDISSEIKDVLVKLEEEELSWRVEDSMAAKINTECAKGQSVTMDDDFAHWTESTMELAGKSGGSFDPTIGNLTRLWNIEGDNPKVPDRKAIDQCMKSVGYEHINIEETQISMEEGTTLDLGAVGKGIGCDVVRDEISDREDIQGAVVAIGGSILVYGEKPEGEKWNVAVQDPDAEDGVPMGVLSLKGEHFISTSGDYEKYFVEDGKKYHHILDPATGYPSESGLRSVTIMCDNGLLSDGLSTACFVLGAEKGMELAKEYQAEAVFITDDNKVIITEGLKDLFQILEEKYEITTLPCVSR